MSLFRYNLYKILHFWVKIWTKLWMKIFLSNVSNRKNLFIGWCQTWPQILQHDVVQSRVRTPDFKPQLLLFLAVFLEKSVPLHKSSFNRLFNRYLLNMCYMLDALLDILDIAVNRTDNNPCLCKSSSLRWLNVGTCLVKFETCSNTEKEECKHTEINILPRKSSHWSLNFFIFY